MRSGRSSAVLGHLDVAPLVFGRLFVLGSVSPHTLLKSELLFRGAVAGLCWSQCGLQP